ncbi:hypothetical protein C8R46DRAFT_1043992 [Mycena filopes]|nr:hypothetical protein C8R46DRAFT_1043992 [Mycena filopes]
MSLQSLSSAAGPSATTLAAMAEYCASADSPSSSFAESESCYSFVSDEVVAQSPKPVPELPPIITHAERFQMASVQEKIMKALRVSTGSGFTRAAPARAKRNRVVSTQAGRAHHIQAIYEGFPPSPSDCFFNDASLVESSTPVHFGLGLLLPSSSSNDFHLASPLAGRRTSPTPRVEGPADILPSRLMLSPTPHSATPTPTQQHTATPQFAMQTPVRYAGLGHGFPARLDRSTTPAPNSAVVLTSMRRISQFLGVDLALSYPGAILTAARRFSTSFKHDAPGPTTSVSQKKGPLGRAATFLREHLRKVSSVVREATPIGPIFRGDIAARGLEAAQDEGLILKRTLASVARFLTRK